MYIKMIGGLFLMSSATVIGLLKAEELNERVKMFQELKKMLMFLQGELRFHKAELSEGFENVASKVEEPYRSFLKEMAEQLNEGNKGGFETIWKENSHKLLRAEGLKKEDEQLFELLGGSLGYLDLTMQTEHLNLVMLRTEETLKEAQELKQSRGKLYQTMGVTAGALLTLLLI